MDVVQLYQDFSVNFVTEGHKHSRPGWVNVECPWCTGNPGYHLGYEIDGNYYYCWRCGWHPVVPTVSKLVNIPEREVRQIIRRYGLVLPRSSDAKVRVRIKSHRLPSNVDVLKRNHRLYLQNRGFDPERLISEWKIMGTGPVSKLDKLDFKYRILIPIIWNNEQVSYTSRDITDCSPFRYLTCPQNREILEHKSILYGKQSDWSSTGICVEGPTDVWRMGTRAFATFGIKYTPRQVRQIAKAFRRVAVMFDDDDQAIVQANKLVAELKFRGVEAWRVPVEGDPGGMKQADADYLIKQIMK